MVDQPNLLNPNPQPINLPNSTTVLVLGIVAIVGAFCYGVVGVICGIIGLVLANKDKKLYAEYPEQYSTNSYSTLNAGRICSIIGLILGAVVIVIMVLYFIFFGAMIMEAVRQAK